MVFIDKDIFEKKLWCLLTEKINKANELIQNENDEEIDFPILFEEIDDIWFILNNDYEEGVESVESYTTSSRLYDYIQEYKQCLNAK